MGLGRKARTATLWSAAQQIGVNGVNTIFTLIFARFLTAEDFGLFAAGSLIIGFLTKIALFGLNTVIVQREEMDKRTVSTAFWMVLCAACLLAGILTVFSTAIAPFFGDPAVALLLPLMAIGMVANVIAMLIGSLFLRNLEIKRLTQRTLIAGFIGGLVSIPLAVAGYGLWTLVFHFLVTSILGAVITMLLADRPVGLTFDRGIARGMLRDGSPIFLTNLLKHFSSESPRIFVALFLSVEALGIFSLATRILTLVQQLTLTPIATVALPVFSELNRSDKARLPELFAMTLKAFILLVLPVIVAGILVIDGMIRLLLGVAWADVGPPAAILLAGALLLPLPFICDSVLVSIGNSRAYLAFSILRAVVGAILLALLTPFGLIYAAIAFLLRGLVVEPVLLFYTIRRLDLAPGPLLRNVLLIYACAAGAGAIAHFAGFVLLDLSYIPAASVGLSVFACVFLLSVRFLAPGNLGLLKKLVGKGRSATSESAAE